MAEYDVIIIGSGPAGYTAAFEAVKNRLKVAIIEKDIRNLGGVCLNEGCIPLKGFLHYSFIVKDYKTIKENVMKKVELLRSGLKSRLQNQGIDIIIGEANFISKDEIKVEDKKIKSKYFVIASGSSPKKYFKNQDVYTPRKIFELDNIPEKILLIGGGAIGCEYASFFNNIGANVEIVEIMDSLVYGEDEDALRVLLREFKKKKIKVYTKSEVKDINESKEVTIKTEKQEIKEKYEMIFETTGRVPNNGNLGLDKAGIELTDKGFIKVNNKMQTNIAGIYAVGDCIDTPMLAYTAYKEAELAILNITNRKGKNIDYSLAPRLVFSSPQIGSIGFNEKRAKGKGINYTISKYFFKAIGKAVVEGRDTGFLKLIIDKDKDHIIGAVTTGEEIVDIMNELTIIIKNKIKIEDIKDCLHIHPSYSEIIIEALR